MKNKIALTTIALIYTVCFTLPVTSIAQDGSLDTSFGNNGIVTTSIGNIDNSLRSIAIQTDGKIVAAGNSYDGTNFNFSLVRYNTNGSIDTSFGIDGIVSTFIGNDALAFSVVIQTDGKIVAAGSGIGSSNLDFALARYETDGSLDSSFGTDGIVTTDIGTQYEHIRSIALQTDGKIVAAGNSYNGSNDDFTLVRYNIDGSLDSNFGTSGIVTTPIGNNHDRVESVAIQTDGKIVVVGESFIGTNNFASVRYNTDGSLDNSFGTNGVVTTLIGDSASAAAVVIQTDGKIVVGGTIIITGSHFDIALARYNADGSLDTSFDNDGIVATLIGYSSGTLSVALQTDGKIVIAGRISNGTNDDFGIARCKIDGSLDNSFGTDGIVTTPIGTESDYARSLAIQADGKIVAAGRSDNGTYEDFAVVRYNNTNTSGINDLSDNLNATLRIFPNPFSEQTSIQSEILLNSGTLTVCNSLGTIVKQIDNIRGQNINLQRDNLPSGLYFVQLKQDNKTIATNKLIITD